MCRLNGSTVWTRNYRRSLVALFTFCLVVGCSDAASEPITEPAPKPAFEVAQPVALEDAQPPVMISIPEIELDASITQMGWRIGQVEGERSTEWDVPYSAAGWQVTSAGAGAEGNVVIIGHQVIGEAVFGQIALGELELGHLIYLTDEAEQTFVYEVESIAEPIPIIGATEEDTEAAVAFTAHSNDAQLTLMTGWPDFSTTHYLFVTAKLVGTASVN